MRQDEIDQEFNDLIYALQELIYEDEDFLIYRWTDNIYAVLTEGGDGHHLAMAEGWLLETYYDILPYVLSNMELFTGRWITTMVFLDET